MSVAARKHIDATDNQIWSAILQNGCNEAVATANIQQACGARSELCKTVSKDFYSTVEYKLFVQSSNCAHAVRILILQFTTVDEER